MHYPLFSARRTLAFVVVTILSSPLAAQPEAAEPEESSLAPLSEMPADTAHVSYAYAQVLNVSPVIEDVRAPRTVEQCEAYERVERTPPRDAGGTVLGAIIGGALGNQVGSGSGRAAATIAGAVVGGAVGREAGSQSTVAGVETRCHQVEEYTLEPQVVGYDVEYRYRGEVFVSRLGHNPGDRLRIRVAVSPAESGGSEDVPAGPQAASYY